MSWAPEVMTTTAKPDYANGKQMARHIFLSTLAAIDVRRVMREKLSFSDGVLAARSLAFPLEQPPRVIAIGKAAVGMSDALHETLGGRVEAGLVVAEDVPAHKLERFQYFQGGHPYPNSGSLNAASAALKLVSGLSAADAVIFLISGGGSALFEQPLDPTVTLRELAEFNHVLVTGGLPIEQMNVLRKHLSAVKGGRLAVAAAPARQLTVYISDVPKNAPSMVASGPSMPDESTCEQAYLIAANSSLLTKFPASIREAFERRMLEETPKPGDGRFANSSYFCALSNRDAVEGAVAVAESMGFRAEIQPGEWDAEYRSVADAALAALEQLVRENPSTPVCVVGGGEVTCEVTGAGVGGRNLAQALYLSQKIAGRKVVALSCSTDGRDGNSPSCGAVADGETIPRAHALGVDPEEFLLRSDSYHFFMSLGDTIETGYTDNNVRDLRILLGFE